MSDSITTKEAEDASLTEPLPTSNQTVNKSNSDTPKQKPKHQFTTTEILERAHRIQQQQRAEEGETYLGGNGAKKNKKKQKKYKKYTKKKNKKKTKKTKKTKKKNKNKN